MRSRAVAGIEHFEELEPVSLRVAEGRVTAPILLEDGVTRDAGLFESDPLAIDVVDDEAELDGLPPGVMQLVAISVHRDIKQLQGD